jgi:ribonucleoside-diphosphate reductase alpha chain
VTINTNGGNQPLEMFINVGKAGSDVTAMAEALGRLASLILRLPSPMTPIDRAQKIAQHLAGIGGARSLGFGENRVRSLPDAVAKILDRHFLYFAKPAAQTNGNGNGHHTEAPAADTPQVPAAETVHVAAHAQQKMVTVDLCPSCGEGSLVFEESCKKCYSCGYSEC